MKNRDLDNQAVSSLAGFCTLLAVSPLIVGRLDDLEIDGGGGSRSGPCRDEEDVDFAPA